MPDSYFTTHDGVWFSPTEYTRGPWDADACHAGPPTALMVRALERLIPEMRLARISVDLLRPVPMTGFRVQAEVRKPGRSATWTEAEVFDEDQVYARAQALHHRTLEPPVPMSTSAFDLPAFDESVPGPFPIRTTRHGLTGFADSLEVRYDPRYSVGDGGPTVIWMRTVPLLPDEEPSGFQRLCPLADSGNGISYNQYLDRVLFLNTDLHVSVHRQPEGEWIGSRVVSHWHVDGTGMSDAELFDRGGPVGRAVQNLLLNPVAG